jgi:predicted enzyme related to lactoylglutathione lyase
MTGRHFVWYELMSEDCASAQAFYGRVLGWHSAPAPMGDNQYFLQTLAGGGQVAGMMPLTAEAAAMGARAAWYGYVSVDSVDNSAAHAERLGAKVHVAPQDIPGIGRFAVLGDPEGAAICLFAGQGEMAPPSLKETGRVGWHELLANDLGTAIEFYAAMFAWQKDRAMDMGPMGTYQLFSDGTEAMGGMMNKPPGMPMPAWLFYFNVDGIDAAVGRVNAGGGKVLHGPMEVPGGSWVVQCTDPQGVMFALVGSRQP